MINSLGNADECTKIKINKDYLTNRKETHLLRVMFELLAHVKILSFYCNRILHSIYNT
jgi:hypothetical protein